MKVGIFGGSFNPIHIGHCILASYILQNGNFDEIWFIVSPQNPLKDKADYEVADCHRIEMVRLAIETQPRLKMCDVEFGLPVPSYSINTLEFLEQKYPDCEFELIIGSDNWLQFNKWRDFEKIISNYGVTVYPRPGYPLNESPNIGNVEFIDAPLIGISSTYIRNSIIKGLDMNFFVPESVLKYIITNKLYGTGKTN